MSKLGGRHFVTKPGAAWSAPSGKEIKYGVGLPSVTCRGFFRGFFRGFLGAFLGYRHCGKVACFDVVQQKIP